MQRRPDGSPSPSDHSAVASASVPRVVDLVRRQEYGPVRCAQDGHHPLIGVGGTDRENFHHEDHDIGLVDGSLRLHGDVCSHAHDIVFPAAGVHQLEVRYRP